MLIHQTIQKVSYDLENLKFNTAIAQLMKLLNVFTDAGKITRRDFRTYLILLNPIAPHITEELWEQAGFEGMLNETSWPEYDENKIKEDEIEIPVQINGKLRARITVPAEADQDEVIAAAAADETVSRLTEGKTIVKEIYVKGKILNIVVK